MNDLAFNKKYIVPFYLKLMNLNFVTNSEAEAIQFLIQLKERANELENDKITELVHDFRKNSYSYEQS